MGQYQGLDSLCCIKPFHCALRCPKRRISHPPVFRMCLLRTRSQLRPPRLGLALGVSGLHLTTMKSVVLVNNMDHLLFLNGRKPGVPHKSLSRKNRIVTLCSATTKRFGASNT